MDLSGTTTLLSLMAFGWNPADLISAHVTRFSLLRLSVRVCRTLTPFFSPDLELIKTSPTTPGCSICCSLEQVVKGDSLISICSIEGLTALRRLEAHLHQVLHLIVHRDLTCIVLRPLGSLPVKCLQIVFVHLGDDRILRVIWLWGAQQGLKRNQSRADGQRWRPLVLQNVQADCACL